MCPPMRFPVGDVVEDSVTYATAPRDDDPDIDKEIYSLEVCQSCSFYMSMLLIADGFEVTSQTCVSGHYDQ